jgi:hypothetical protein
MKLLTARPLAVCLVFTVLVGLLTNALTAPSAEPEKTAGWLSPAAVAVSAPAAEEERVERRLGYRERRALGLTFRNVRRVLDEMDQDGELEGKSSSMLAVEVFDHLVDENPQEFSAVAEVDWDAILDFLTKLIELILKLLILFS